MKIIFELLKKDLIKFRWPLALWVALVVSWNVVLCLFNNTNFEVMLGGVTVLKVLSGFFLPVLTLLIMQADAVAGGKAFWLTRPVPPWIIFVCKTTLMLALALILVVAASATTLTLFQVPMKEIGRQTWHAVLIWFHFVPVYMLVASVTRNFFSALGVLLVLALMFIICTLIEPKIHIFILFMGWISMVALPLAGTLFQYQTRRTWVTVSGCILAFVIIAIYRSLVPVTMKNTPDNPPNFSEHMAVENIMVSVRDKNVIVSGEFKAPEQGMFEWTIPFLAFATADGEIIPLFCKSLTFHAQGADETSASVSSPGGVKKFETALAPDELKKIQGKTGALRMSVSGKSFHYKPLTVVPLNGTRWVTNGNIRIIAVQPEDKADRDTVAELMFFTTEEFWFIYSENEKYQYMLCRADGAGKILLTGRIVYRMISEASFVRLSTRATKPESLDGWQVRIDRRVYDEKQTVGDTFEIPNFTASGTN